MRATRWTWTATCDAPPPACTAPSPCALALLVAAAATTVDHRRGTRSSTAARSSTRTLRTPTRRARSPPCAPRRRACHALARPLGSQPRVSPLRCARGACRRHRTSGTSRRSSAPRARVCPSPMPCVAHANAPFSPTARSVPRTNAPKQVNGRRPIPEGVQPGSILFEICTRRVGSHPCRCAGLEKRNNTTEQNARNVRAGVRLMCRPPRATLQLRLQG